MKEAGDREATIVTNPVECTGVNMTANVDCPDGSLEVAILDENGNAIDGPSDRISMDGLAVPVKWASGDTAKLVGRRVRLQFNLTAGRLYSCNFCN